MDLVDSPAAGPAERMVPLTTGWHLLVFVQPGNAAEDGVLTAEIMLDTKGRQRSIQRSRCSPTADKLAVDKVLIH